MVFFDCVHGLQNNAIVKAGSIIHDYHTFSYPAKETDILTNDHLELLIDRLRDVQHKYYLFGLQLSINDTSLKVSVTTSKSLT